MRTPRWVGGPPISLPAPAPGEGGASALTAAVCPSARSAEREPPVTATHAHMDPLPFQCQRPLSSQISASPRPFQWPGRGALLPPSCSGEPSPLAPPTPWLFLVTRPFPCSHLRNLDLLSQTHRGRGDSLKGVLVIQTRLQLLGGGFPEATAGWGREPDLTAPTCPASRCA